MLQRLYVHNFRCLENFELSIKEPSALLIGQNGTGKSTIRAALEILQKISRNVNRVGELIKSKDFTRGRSDLPIRFEIEILLNEKLYKYILALELPTNFTELKILEEQFSVAGIPVYSRKGAQVTVHYNSANKEAQFFVDWHLVALPLIQMQSETDPLHIFRTWLARAIILAPIPSIISGESDGETLNPEVNGSNFGNWFSGLLSRYPAAYTLVDKYLREVMPDIVDFHNEFIGKDSKNMLIRFQEKSTSLSVNFKALSDGEKCYFLCAAVLAANKFYGPLFCFWDEPDNYLSISEVGHFVTSLRRAFDNAGQIFITSHNSEAIRKFSNEKIFLLQRRTHLDPTLIRSIQEIPIEGDLINALIRGDLESYAK